MRFVSKNSNLCIILRPGIPAQPITGTPAVPTLSVRFQNGVVDVVDQEMIEMMQGHKSNGIDFIAIESGERDPFKSSRLDLEPKHQVMEMKFGTPVSVKNQNVGISQDMEKMINDRATAIAKAILPDMLKEALKSIAESGDVTTAPKTPQGEAELEKVVVTPATTPKKAPARTKK